MKIITENREASMVLEGSEVKSLRAGKANLKDSYAIIKGREVFLLNCNIACFEKSGAFVPDPTRTRKLLLNKQEILKLQKKN